MPGRGRACMAVPPDDEFICGEVSVRYLSSSVAFACAIVCSSPLAAQTTTLTASFSKGAIAEYTSNPNGTDNARLFSTLGIASMSISQQSSTGSWGGTQGNDTAVTAKITFTNGTTTSFPAAINWVKNAGGGQFDWIGLTISGITVADGYPLTTGKEKTYILQFAQSSFNMTAAVQADPNSLDGSANAGAAINALNLYFPSSVAAAPVITGPTGGAGATSSAISVNENQTAVTTLTANKAVTWAITGGTDGAKFAISAGGVITFLAAPDYEVPTDGDTNNTYVLTVTATDSNGGVSTQTVTVTVLNLDDTLPVVAPNQSFSYAENRAANDTVGTVVATDNVAVTRFRFAATSTQTSADGYYTIDNAGAIRITAAGVAAGVANNDFEIAPNSFIYAVQAGDAANNWSAATNVALNVTDADDTAPVITAGQSFSFAENQSANAQVGTVIATDAVGVTDFRFTATGTQTSADGFYTVDAGGVIRITAAGVAAGIANNDFEVAPNSFTYGLQARDAAGNWSASGDVTLNVTDLDDIAPVITGGQLFSYAENRAAGALLGTVQASDAGGVTGFRFASTGSSTSADGFFAVDGTGNITLTSAGAAAGAASNDFEISPNSFTLALQARDAAGNWSTSTNVGLNVTNLDDTGPAVGAGQSFSYAENQAANAIVGTVAATDDTGVTAFRFGASGTQTSADGYYTIDNAGVIRITAVGTAAGVANNDFEIAPNNFTYTVEAGDAAGNWSPATSIGLAVTNVDDSAPTVAAGQSFSYAENRASGALLGTVAASDDTGVTGFRFTGTGTTTSADGFFAIDSSGRITLTAAGAAAGAASNDYEVSPNSFSLGVEARDAAGNWSSSSLVTLAVTDIDDAAPSITAGQSFSYNENQAANAVVGTVAASDNVGVSAFRFAAMGTQTSADGFYSVDNSGVIRLTVAGAAAGAATNDFETAPNSFTYGLEAGDAAGNWSAPANVTLNVADVNETVNTAPVIGAGQSLSYPENQVANAVIGTVAATDNSGVTAFRFGATGTQSSADGYYTIDNGGAVRITAAGIAAGVANNDFEIAPNSFVYAIEAGDTNGSWSPATNVTFAVTDLADTPPVITGPGGSTGATATIGVPEGTTTVTQVTANVPISSWAIVGGNDQGRFRIDAQGNIVFTTAPDYEAPTDSDTNNGYVLVIEGTDASGNKATQTITVNVTNVADTPPVITGPSGSTGGGATISVPEGTTAVAQVTSSVPGSTWAITGGNDQGRFSIDAQGNFVFTAAPDYEAPADSDTNNSYVLVIEATAPDGSKTTQTITVNVTNVGDTPVVITGPGGSTGGNATVSVPEGTTAVTRVSSSVPGSTWSITGGNDRGRFNIDAQGNIVFTAAPDYEGPTDSDTNNSYVLVIEATAPDGSKTTQTITVNVTNVADTPPVTSGPGGSGAASTVSVPEGTTAVTQVTSSVPGTSWAIAGGNDQGRFTIDAQGNIRFVSSPDFEAPTDSDTNNSYVLVIEATGPDGSTSTQTVTVNVTNLADNPPVISGQGGSGAASTVSVPEGTTAVTQVTSSVPGTSWSIAGGNDQGRFTIDAQGNISFVASPDFEAPTDSDTNNSYVLVIEATAPDGSTSTQTVTVNVTNLADNPPVITGPGGATGGTATISVPENEAAVTQLTSSVAGTTWSITTGDDRGRFSIDAGGNLVFNTAPDFDAPSDVDANNSYVLVVEAMAPDGSRTTQTITLNVTNLADMPPVITGPNGTTGGSAAISVPEGTSTVTQVTASVPGSTWAITSGNDQGRFTIDAQGNIRFVAAPDFEAPTDSDTNNSYVLVVEATAPDGSRTTQTVTVNVTNLADTPPVLTGPSGGAGALASAIAVNEGTTAVTTLTSNRPVTWSIIGGTDRGQFSINAQGQISFVAAPNFEAPTDIDRNNSYVLTVEAVDANGERSQQTITVTVLNVDELQRKLNEIGANLRGSVRNHAFASLSSMLSFNEGLLGLDGQCASAGSRRPLSGGLEANENRQDARLRVARDLSSCEARTRIFVDGGVGFSRVARNWTTRGLASARLEHLVGSKTVLGAALIGTAASDELGSFGDSRISDESLQLNVYGRTHLSERLRFAAFAGVGRAWYRFRLEDGGLDLTGDATGKRHLYGAALSGDIRFGRLTVATDAILSRAVEKLGEATLDASFAGESGRDMLFRLGRVDMTRLSVPVHVPILFGSPKDGREATRLDISPGLLCQDTAADSSALDCGYQLGFKFRLAPTVRSLLRAEARTEYVDGYLLNSLTVGFQRRFGSLDQLSWGMDASRMAGGNRDENRVMVRVVSAGERKWRRAP